MQENKKTKFICRKCKKDMVNLTTNMDFMSFLAPQQMYCNNNKCNYFGFVTVASIALEEDKNK